MGTTPKKTATKKKVTAGPPPLPVVPAEGAAIGSQFPPTLPPEVPPSIPQYQYYAQPGYQRKPGSGSFLKAITAAFLNLNGFGLGYFWSKGKIFGLVEIGGTALILTAAFFFQNMENKLFWLLGLLGWVLAHAVWGAIRAAKPEHQFGLQPSLGVLLLVGIGALVIEGGLFAVIRAVGNVSRDAGAVAYQQEDFKIASSRYGLADAMYRLTFSDEIDGTTYYHGVSKLVVEIRGLIDSGNYADVPDKVDSLIDKDPDLTVFAHDLGIEAILGLTADLEKAGDFEGAADQFKFAMTAYPRAESYEDAQNAYYDELIRWGGSLMEAKNYKDAVTTYRRADIELSMIVHQHSDFVSLVGQAYIKLAEQQETSKEYESAIASLQEFQNYYPASSLDSTVRKKYPVLYLKLAQQQLDNKEFGKAVENYELVISAYPTSTQAETAKGEVAEAYLGYGDELAKAGDNEGAYDVYKKALALDIPEEDRARVILALGSILLEIGKDQTSQGLYIEAVASLNEGKSYTTDETLTGDLNAAITAAIEALADDTGTQGQQVMDEAVANACAGIPATSEAVNYYTSEAGKALECDYSSSLPSGLVASTPGELRFVVSFDSGSSTISSCPYNLVGGGYATLYRIMYSETVTIRYADTGKLYTTKTFYGGSPGSCPYSYYFYGNSGSLYGSAVDQTEVTNWLNSVIK
jgi:tetratricopeptide (TPR) repeat protein